MSFREGAQRQASAQNGAFWKTTSVLRLRWDFFGVDSSEASGPDVWAHGLRWWQRSGCNQKMHDAMRASRVPHANKWKRRGEGFVSSFSRSNPAIRSLHCRLCPAYSAFLGKKKGAQDGQGRGLLVFEGLKYIARWKPSVVVLESVARQSAPSRQSARGRHKKKLTWQSARSRRKLKQLTWQSARSRRKNKQKTCDNQNYYIILKVFR